MVLLNIVIGANVLAFCVRANDPCAKKDNVSDNS